VPETITRKERNMGRYLLLLLWLFSFAAIAAETPDVSVKLAGPGIEVRSSIVLPIKPCEAYAMLSDYGGLPKFIPGLLSSHYRRIARHRVEVTQVGEVQVFIFHMRMESLLDMEEIPDRRIVFRQSKGDFISYSGEWNFSASGDGVQVGYRASMTFKPYVPLLLARSILEHDVKEKFAAIGREAAARKKRGLLHCMAEMQE
jgi:ribosome-associated toxin RatA of RatAB toxin-antitoxin module